MEPWATYRSELTDVSSHSSKSRHPTLLGVAGLCAALWAVILTNVVDKGVATGGWLDTARLGTAAAAAPQLAAYVRISSVDVARLTAAVNVTLRGLPTAASLAALHGGGGAGSSSKVSVRIGGVAREFDVVGSQQPGASEASFQATADLTEVAAARLRPFDAYAFDFGPLPAMLRVCSGGGGGGGMQQGGDRQPQEQQQQQQDGGGDCLSVVLPVRFVADGSGAPGFKFAPRSGGAAAAAAVGDGEFVITRATSQRVLRLLSLMLQWLATTYVVAWGAGAIVAQWLLNRCLGRMHFMV
jgi:hypothetical protein